MGVRRVVRSRTDGDSRSGGSARAAKRAVQRESPQPALPIAQIRGRKVTPVTDETCECACHGWTFPTVADFDNHRKELG